MPPKAKFSKEEIVEAALSIVRRDGFQALTARALGDALGSSARPIFTVFRSMDEVQEAVLRAAKDMYRQFVEAGFLQVPAFKGVGTQYIHFAMQEPKLFQLLFMAEQEQIPDFTGVLPLIEESYDRIVYFIKKDYGMSDAAAMRLYRHLWIYTHGIAALCATGMCRFTEEEISGMMTEVFVGLLKKMREGDSHD